MTDPRDIQLPPRTEATIEDREPEVNPEVISDLDVTDADADVIRAGCVAGLELAMSHTP
jgi:hypothetical protein